MDTQKLASMFSGLDAYLLSYRQLTTYPHPPLAYTLCLDAFRLLVCLQISS